MLLHSFAFEGVLSSISVGLGIYKFTFVYICYPCTSKTDVLYIIAFGPFEIQVFIVTIGFLLWIFLIFKQAYVVYKSRQ
jgi:hypothetical protein